MALHQHGRVGVTLDYHADGCRYLKAELIEPIDHCLDCGTPLYLSISRVMGYCDDHICDCPYLGREEEPRARLANVTHPRVQGV